MIFFFVFDFFLDYFFFSFIFDFFLLDFFQYILYKAGKNTFAVKF